MDFETGKRLQGELEARLDAASATLAAFPRGAMGLTPDSVKALPEWRDAKAAVDKAFADLRAFNASFVPRFARELAAERRERRARLARDRSD